MSDENKPTITIPKELFNWLLEDAMELKGAWDWKNSGYPRYQREYDQLCERIKAAEAIAR